MCFSSVFAMPGPWSLHPHRHAVSFVLPRFHHDLHVLAGVFHRVVDQVGDRRPHLVEIAHDHHGGVAGWYFSALGGS